MNYCLMLSRAFSRVLSIPPAFPPRLRTPPKTIEIGPDSHHSGVINHALADGSVRSISKEIDAAAYMFLITRNAGDPAPPLD